MRYLILFMLISTTAFAQKSCINNGDGTFDCQTPVPITQFDQKIQALQNQNIGLQRQIDVNNQQATDAQTIALQKNSFIQTQIDQNNIDISQLQASEAAIIAQPPGTPIDINKSNVNWTDVNLLNP